MSLRPDLEDADDSACSALSSSCVRQGLNSRSSSASKHLADSYLILASNPVNSDLVGRFHPLDAME